MTTPAYQKVKKIFNAALRHPPVERFEFLDQTCGEDMSLRAEVESLLSSFKSAESFLETPLLSEFAESLLSEDSRLTTGQRFGQYQIIEQIGVGGMGEVYLARDKKLKRRVALKLLPARLITDKERQKRFEQEAFAISSLNHPNILTIYEIGEHEDTHFISTEYVDGVPLNEWDPADEPVSLTRILDIAVQISSALSTAHERGVLHRDIKPENIMVRSDGIIKVLDFGVAKLTEKHRTIDDGSSGNITDAGMVLGTASYMSPEQARGKETDERTDIWSLGVVLYEMLSGQKPFLGETPTDIIVEIIHKEPPPLSDYLACLPSELEGIVSKTLCKEPGGRHQTARELQEDLEKCKQKIEFEDALGNSVPPHREAKEKESEGPTTKIETARPTLSAEYLVDQIRTHKTFAISIIPAMLIGIMAAGYYFISGNLTPVLTDKDVILLLDFENKTGEKIFDGTLKQGLLIQLKQSPFLSVFPEAEIHKTLELMKRDPKERLTRQMGREICQRRGLKAYVVGTISKLGNLYVVGIEAVNSQTGEKIAITQSEAASKEKVTAALSAAATDLRKNLGEPLALIGGFDEPLPDVTTKSLDALQAYALAEEMRDLGNKDAAIALYKKAIEIDPEFATAYIDLGDMYDLVRKDLQEEAYMKAYELRNKLSEREKLELDEIYALVFEKDMYKMIKVLKIGKMKYPRDEEIRVGLVRGYHLTGQYEKAVSEGREVLQINPKARYLVGQMASALIKLDRFDEVKEVVRASGNTPGFSDLLFRVALAQDDTEAMQEQYRLAEQQGLGYLALIYQGGAALHHGQWRKTLDLADRAREAIKPGSDDIWLLKGETGLAAEAANLGKCKMAKALVDKLLRSKRHRDDLRLPQALAKCGEFARARALMIEKAKKDPAMDVNSVAIPTLDAQIELKKGNAIKALTLLELTRKFEITGGFLPLYVRAQAYLKLNENEKARIEFQKILDHRGRDVFSVLYPLAQLGKARASKDKGEYEKLFEMWKDADRDLPALVNARREYEILK